MSEHQNHHDGAGSKQHAQRRDRPPRTRPLWVYDPQDWALMQEMSSGMLVCPLCRNPFQRPVENSRGTRFLRDMPNSYCPHSLARSEGGGGPISQEHRWLQAALARMCEDLGYEAITEHRQTNADIYVPKVRLVIEVQRWSTSFEKRTAARRENGAEKVLWFLTQELNEPGPRKALFTLPAARLLVHRKGDRTQPAAPWADQRDGEAELTVSATVSRRDPATGTLVTGAHDAKQFLGQILGDERRWYPPGTRGLPDSACGCWVLEGDLDWARAFMRQRELDEWLLQQDEDAGRLFRVRPEPAVIPDPELTPPLEQVPPETEQASLMVPETQPVPTKEPVGPIGPGRVKGPDTTGKVRRRWWWRLANWFSGGGG